jgi:hypothetical protein
METYYRHKHLINQVPNSGSLYLSSLLNVEIKEGAILHLQNIYLCFTSNKVLVITEKSSNIEVLWEGSLRLKGVSNHYCSVEYYLQTLHNRHKISFVSEYVQENEFQVHIYLEPNAFLPVEDPADEYGVNRKCFSGLKDNMKCLFQCFHELKDDCVQYKVNSRHYQRKSVEDLYNYIQDYCKHHRKNMDPCLLSKYQPQLLLPTIRDYQVEAIHWMVCQEKYSHSSNYVFYIFFKYKIRPVIKMKTSYLNILQKI